MSRQTAPYEKELFEIVREYNVGFYYHNINRTVDSDDYKMSVEKEREEMIGKARVTLKSGDNIEYQIKYNRILNLCDGYTLTVPGLKVG